MIKGLKKCDFTPMYDHAMAEREKKKALRKEVKLLCVNSLAQFNVGQACETDFGSCTQMDMLLFKVVYVSNHAACKS